MAATSQAICVIGTSCGAGGKRDMRRLLQRHGLSPMDRPHPVRIMSARGCDSRRGLSAQEMTGMQHWTVDHHGARGAAGALAGVIGAIGSPTFGEQALAAMNDALGAASWSVYRVYRDREPVIHASASLGVPDTTRDCFSAYRSGLYRRDRSFDAVHAQGGRPTLLRMRAEEAPTREHRERIYASHGLVERLSLAMLDADGSLLAVNLYHHRHQGPFSGGECESLAGIAGGVLAAVRRHVAWAEAAVPQDPRAALAAACPALTPRELDVCERLLRGWTHDGIAADLSLTKATVKTYRARAFERLGLHFRCELFARFGAGVSQSCRPLG
jgi:DNA-binding CsgD family transcriptional regulator